MENLRTVLAHVSLMPSVSGAGQRHSDGKAEQLAGPVHRRNRNARRRPDDDRGAPYPRLHHASALSLPVAAQCGMRTTSLCARVESAVSRPPFIYCVGLECVEICVELAHEYVLVQFRFKTLSSMSCTQTISAPPVPPLKAQTSPLVNLFNQGNNTFTPNINKGRMFTRSIYFFFIICLFFLGLMVS